MAAIPKNASNVVFLRSSFTHPSAEEEGVAGETLFSEWQGAENGDFAVDAAALEGFNVPISTV